MDLILCHTTADFDTLGAAVGLTRLQPGSRIVLTGGCHPGVKDFLALHRDEYPLIERRSVNPEQIRSVTIVDTQHRDRLGKAAEWLNLSVPIHVWDHHPEESGDIHGTHSQIELVGATTTLIVEQLRHALQQASQGSREPLISPVLTVAEATVMALGIHVDTGSLTYDHTTARDASALTWLMEQGASLSVIAEYVEPGLSPQLQELLTRALDELQTEALEGYTLSWLLLGTSEYVPGLSSLVSRLMELTESDGLLLANHYPLKAGNEERLSIIGRSRIAQTNLKTLFKSLGGGGHPRAASVSLRDVNPRATLEKLIEDFKAQIPQQPVARELMSSPVRTIRPETTVHEAQRILLRYGHSGLSVVDERGKLVGVISRRDIDIALHHGFSHAPVKGYMTTNVKTITPDTRLAEIEELMVTYDVGRLPVLQDERLEGIVTRTDVLRQLHQDNAIGKKRNGIGGSPRYCILPQSIEELLRDRLSPPLWKLLTHAAELAEQRGWHLYLVGGAVRDLLLAASGETGTEAGETRNLSVSSVSNPSVPQSSLLLTDIDLVVDGFHRAADAAAGVQLAKELQKLYPAARLDIHGQFQTAALLWHKDPRLNSLWVDIATARTEFYPYPAANPEVEASSIRQDLYRRDFTINALAVRLTGPSRRGELLDFFGGWLDLQDRRICVLHANSFIEDPTRIYRAVRFAVRLGFEIEPQTKRYIRLAIESGMYQLSSESSRRVPALETRLKTELKYILQAPYWKPALQLLGDLDALRCIHPTLELDKDLWRQLLLVDRLIRRIGSAGGGGSQGGQTSPVKNFPSSVSHPQPQDSHSPILNSFNLPEYWEIRLEVIIAHLASEYRGQVASNLQLSVNSIKRLEELATASDRVSQVSGESRVSDRVLLLRGYDVATLMLIAVNSPRTLRRQIWEYLTTWADAKPLLNGNDFKALGYKPGPQYKEMLETLLAATVDGVIHSRSDAEAFLAEHFPHS